MQLDYGSANPLLYDQQFFDHYKQIKSKKIIIGITKEISRIIIIGCVIEWENGTQGCD